MNHTPVTPETVRTAFQLLHDTLRDRALGQDRCRRYPALTVTGSTAYRDAAAHIRIQAERFGLFPLPDCACPDHPTSPDSDPDEHTDQPTEAA